MLKADVKIRLIALDKLWSDKKSSNFLAPLKRKITLRNIP